MVQAVHTNFASEAEYRKEKSMGYSTDTTKPIMNELYKNAGFLIGTIDGTCESYEEGYITAEHALKDIRTAIKLHDEARIILTNEKSDYPAKD